MVISTWATIEQDPAGLWWITTDATIGPYLDEVQALRALQVGPDFPWTVVVVHTTTTGRHPPRNRKEGRDGPR